MPVTNHDFRIEPGFVISAVIILLFYPLRVQRIRFSTDVLLTRICYSVIVSETVMCDTDVRLKK